MNKDDEKALAEVSFLELKLSKHEPLEADRVVWVRSQLDDLADYYEQQMYVPEELLEQLYEHSSRLDLVTEAGVRAGLLREPPKEQPKAVPSREGSLPECLAVFYSCFVSYSHKDEAFCRILYRALKQRGIKTWLATEDIRGGKKIHEQVREQIGNHDKLLLVLSEHSLDSEWVKSEIKWARQRELREGRRIMFPIRLVKMDVLRSWSHFDADTGRDLAAEIREYFIPDFSSLETRPTELAIAVDRLVRDLGRDDLSSC